jgi:hypothetical protein
LQNASAIFSTGGNEKDVMEGLGLKTFKMVYRYGHLTNDHKRETLARVSGLLSVWNKRRTYSGHKTKKPSFLTAFLFLAFK